MAQKHDHAHETTTLGNGRILVAAGCNFLLTVVEVIGGLASGSLSLVADALHNLNDCASLLIALIARKISRKPADERRTFGYRRAEVIGALINLTILIVVGLYLVYEAVWRFMNPREIEGWTVLVIAAVALVVDVATAVLLHAMSRGSLNVRAALLHNISDALGSLGVIVVGLAVLLWQFSLLDVFVTLLIAGYILWQSTSMIRRSIQILMESVPDDVDINRLAREMQCIDGIVDIHHVHVWQLDEQHRAMEAHVVIESDGSRRDLSTLKRQLKQLLSDSFGIHHSTLEFELEDEYPTASKHDTEVVSHH